MAIYLSSASLSFLKPYSLTSSLQSHSRKKISLLTCGSTSDSNEDYLLDAPVSIGDGFSFSGGKYSDEPSPADEWFKQGKIVKAHPVGGTGEKAKDPIFGLVMAGSSQASSDLFRDYELNTCSFCAIDGFASKVEAPTIHLSF